MQPAPPDVPAGRQLPLRCGDWLYTGREDCVGPAVASCPALMPGGASSVGRNSAVFALVVPIGLFLFEYRRSRFSPEGMVPGDCLQSIVAGREDHRWIGRFAVDGVELNRDLATGISPVSKGGDRTFAGILSDRSGTVRTQANAECRTGRSGRCVGIRRFGAVDTGVFRDAGKKRSCGQRQNNDRGAG